DQLAAFVILGLGEKEGAGQVAADAHLAARWRCRRAPQSALCPRGRGAPPSRQPIAARVAPHQLHIAVAFNISSVNVASDVKWRICPQRRSPYPRGGSLSERGVRS